MLAMWIENPILSYNEILDFGAPFNGSRLCKNSSFGQNGPVRYALILTSSLRLLIIGLNLEIQTSWLEFLHSLDPMQTIFWRPPLCGRRCRRPRRHLPNHLQFEPGGLPRSDAGSCFSRLREDVERSDRPGARTPKSIQPALKPSLISS